MNDIKDMLGNIWDSLLGRFAIFSVVLGWVPFLLLTMAHKALTKS